MHRSLVVLTVSLSILGACSSGSAPSAPAQTAAAAAEPAAAASASPAALKDWQLELTMQFNGATPGPSQVVNVDSEGAVKVTVGGKVVGQATLPATELGPLVALLAEPGLAAAKPGKNFDGPQTQLIVTGDVEVEMRGMTPALRPVIREVDRLRDLVAPPEHFKVHAVEGELEVMVASSGLVEVKRGGALVAKSKLSAGLTELTTLLAAPSLRTVEAWSAPGGAASLKVEGDIAVAGPLDGASANPAAMVLREALRLGARVEASATPMVKFEASLTRQEAGPERQPARRFEIRSQGRYLGVVHAAPGTKAPGRPLSEAELQELAVMLADPDLRTPRDSLEGVGVGPQYSVEITGDQAMTERYLGPPPPVLLKLMDRLEALAHERGLG